MWDGQHLLFLSRVPVLNPYGAEHFFMSVGHVVCLDTWPSSECYNLNRMIGYQYSSPTCSIINSLAPGIFGSNFKIIIFELCHGLISWALIVKLLKEDWYTAFDQKSTLVQVMAWHHQATRSYLSQCWPISKLPHGMTRPQCVNFIACSSAIKSKY